RSVASEVAQVQADAIPLGRHAVGTFIETEVETSLTAARAFGEEVKPEERLSCSRRTDERRRRSRGQPSMEHVIETVDAESLPLARFPRNLHAACEPCFGPRIEDHSPFVD